MAGSSMLDRREFTLQAALAILAGATVTVAGCGGGSGSPAGASPVNSGAQGTTGSTGSGDVQGSISGNHGHVAMITAAQLAAGNTITLTIPGAADHPHVVELTAADLGRLAGNQAVSKDSSEMAAHHHTVTFSRTGELPGPGY
jgi:hypothetical protein